MEAPAAVRQARREAGHGAMDEEIMDFSWISYVFSRFFMVFHRF